MCVYMHTYADNIFAIYCAVLVRVEWTLIKKSANMSSYLVLILLSEEPSGVVIWVGSHEHVNRIRAEKIIHKT